MDNMNQMPQNQPMNPGVDPNMGTPVNSNVPPVQQPMVQNPAMNQMPQNQPMSPQPRMNPGMDPNMNAPVNPAMSPEAMAFLSGQDNASGKAKKSKRRGGFFPGFLGGILGVIILTGIMIFNGSLTLDDILGSGNTNETMDPTVMGETIQKLETDVAKVRSDQEDFDTLLQQTVEVVDDFENRLKTLETASLNDDEENEDGNNNVNNASSSSNNRSTTNNLNTNGTNSDAEEQNSNTNTNTSNSNSNTQGNNQSSSTSDQDEQTSQGNEELTADDIRNILNSGDNE